MTEPVLDPGLDQSTVGLLNGLADTQVVDYFGSPVFRGYSNQPSVSTIRLHKARRDYTVEGSNIVAILDTGVDPGHPALSNALVPGYDFTRDLPGIPDEKSDLDQSTVGLLNQSTVGLLNQSTVGLLNQSTVGLLNQSTVGLLNAALADPRYSAFGHGTMVAGLVRLVAPGAQIMPLKVFRSDGTASVADIVRGVYFAVENGASVINMSFQHAGLLARPRPGGELRPPKRSGMRGLGGKPERQHSRLSRLFGERDRGRRDDGSRPAGLLLQLRRR